MKDRPIEVECEMAVAGMEIAAEDPVSQVVDTDATTKNVAVAAETVPPIIPAVPINPEIPKKKSLYINIIPERSPLPKRELIRSRKDNLCRSLLLKTGTVDQ